MRCWASSGKPNFRPAYSFSPPAARKKAKEDIEGGCLPLGPENMSSANTADLFSEYKLGPEEKALNHLQM